MSELCSTLESRAEALLRILEQVPSGGQLMSTATVGSEREAVATLLLGNVIAPPFRLGSGDIIDASGAQSGQMDIVVEHTPSVSIPLISGLHPRLYLAEGIAAVVEVKSDLSNQWREVKGSSDTLGKVKRNYKQAGIVGSYPPPYIPYYVVAYKGYKNAGTLQKHIEDMENKNVGVLSLSPCFYCSRNENLQEKGVVTSEGPIAILRFMIEIELQIKKCFGVIPRYEKYDKELSYEISNRRFR